MMKYPLMTLAVTLGMLAACAPEGKLPATGSRPSAEAFSLSAQSDGTDASVFKDFAQVSQPGKITLYQTYFQLQGKRFTAAKLLDKDQQISSVTVDAQGVSYTSEQLQALYPPASQGKLDLALAELLATQSPETVPVMIELNVPGLPILDKPTAGDGHSLMASLMAEHEKNLAFFQQEKQQKLASLKFTPDEALEDLVRGPAVLAVLRPERIKQLESHPDVLAISYQPDEGQDLLAQAIELTAAREVHFGGPRYQGQNIKVAVWERGCPTESAVPLVKIKSRKKSYQFHNSTHYFPLCEPLTASVLPPISQRDVNSQRHATQVASVIANHGSPSGIAPEVGLLAANSYKLSGLDWALKHQANVINHSSVAWRFLQTPPNERSIATTKDRYTDHALLYPPYAVLVQAAGNDGFERGKYVLHKDYNGLSVGATHAEQQEMADYSSARNPLSPRGDRELPQLVTAGNLNVHGESIRGTSFSTPIVAGGAALLQGIEPLLTLWPTGVKALLMGGAVKNIPKHPGFSSGVSMLNSADGSVYDPNMASSTWSEDLRARKDGFDGAGALNLFESMQIAQQRWRGQPLFEGWDIGTINNASFPGGKQTFQNIYQIPVLSERQKVRVALSWEQTASTFVTGSISNTPVDLNYDLDVLVKDENGEIVASSTSFDNNYEIVDFQGEPGKSYAIHVLRGETPTHINGKENFTSYGIAWNLHTQDMKSTPQTYADTLVVCDNNLGIFRMKPDGTDVYKLFDRENCADISWSSSKNQIAVNSYFALSVIDTAMPRSELRHLVGSGSLRLLRFTPRWSPDGKWLAFAAEKDGVKALYVIKGDGSMAVPLKLAGTENNFLFLSVEGRYKPGNYIFQWGNNSQTVYFLKDKQLYQVNVGAERTYPVAQDIDSRQFSLSPDNQALAFASQQALQIYDLTNQRSEMLTAHADLQQLTGRDVLRIEDPLWSPDGQQIAFRLRFTATQPDEPQAAMFVYDLGRKKVKRFPGEWKDIYRYVWASDSKDLLVSVPGELFLSSPNQLLRLSPDTGALQLNSGFGVSDFDWSAL